MASPFVAEIRMFAFQFAPRNWAFCDGQLLPIAQNTALFSLLGTNYGGDGKSTYALPNFQGSAPLGQGVGPGLSFRYIGDQGGSESVTLVQTEIPVHNHPAYAANPAQSPDHTPNPTNAMWGSGGRRGLGQNLYAPSVNGQNTSMSPFATAVTGGSMPHNNMQPYLTLNFCIALYGVYPPRP